MISGLTEFEGQLIAANNRGELILWQLGKTRFENNISLSRSQRVIHLCQDPLLSLLRHNELLITYTKKELHLVRLSQAPLAHTVVTWRETKAHEYITSVNILEQKLLIVTKCGAFYIYDPLNGETTHFFLDLFKLEANGLQFVAVKDEITSSILYRQSTLVLLSCSNGRLFIASLVSQSVLMELAHTNSQFDPIHHMQLYDDRLYCLHKRYITQWSIKFGTCLSFISMMNPQCIFKHEDTLYLGGPHCEVARWEETKLDYLQTSLRCVTVITIVGNWIAMGGSDNMVDIYSNSTRLATLFK